MTTAFAIKTLVEFGAILLLIFGFINEEKVIEFEQNIKRIIVGNYRRYKRLQQQKKAGK